MTIEGLVRDAEKTLGEHGLESPRVDAEHLVAKVVGIDRAGLRGHGDRTVGVAHLEEARRLVARRAAREPLQYVLGEWDFRRLTLTLDRRALIPRPETEVVVERCLALLAGRDTPRVLDVGTGSGAIALALAHEHGGARVTAMDSSVDALALAADNVTRTGLAVELLRLDLFDGLPAGPWELVVSNPPYVEEAELATLEPEVRDWEPEAALLGHGHGAAVATGALAVLAPGGALVLETHADRASETAAFLRDEGYADVRVTHDLTGRERVVEGIAPGRASERDDGRAP